MTKKSKSNEEVEPLNFIERSIIDPAPFGSYDHFIEQYNQKIRTSLDCFLNEQLNSIFEKEYDSAEDKKSDIRELVKAYHAAKTEHDKYTTKMQVRPIDINWR